MIQMVHSVSYSIKNTPLTDFDVTFEKADITMERNNRFLAKEYNKALLPVMCSVLGGTINTFIDSAFVARRLDHHALAAVNLNMPIFLLLCAVGCLLGVGASVSASRALGRNDTEAASDSYHSAILWALILSAIFMFIGFFLHDETALILCRDPELFPMVRDYCRITLIGALGYILVYFPSYFLQLYGAEWDITMTMVILVVSDIILDWLFLFALDKGVAGAALASILSTALSCMYGFIRMQKPGGIFRFQFKKLHIKNTWEIFKFGSSLALSTLLDTSRILILNWMLAIAGGSEALAIWAVINSFLEISLCITGGVPRTAAPLLGIYVTSHDNEGVRLLTMQELKTGTFLAAVYGLVLVILHQTVAAFFKIGASLLVPLIFMAVTLVLWLPLTVLMSYYNVADHVALSNFVSTLRSFGAPLFFGYILCLMKGYIWLFLPLGAMAALLLTLIAAYIKSKQQKESGHFVSSVLLLDDFLETHNMIKSFSFVSSDEHICKASEDIMDFFISNNMDRKQANRIGLALEEVMTVMARRSLRSQEDPVDIRIYSSDNTIGLNIMCFGQCYNIFEEAENHRDDEANIGIKMINRMSKERRYLYTMGINILSLEFMI